MPLVPVTVYYNVRCLWYPIKSSISLGYMEVPVVPSTFYYNFRIYGGAFSALYSLL